VLNNQAQRRTPLKTNYPEYLADLQQLAAKLGKEVSGPMSSFAALHRNALAEGVLSRKLKELIALAIGIGARCGGCIAYHTHDALKAGATRQEILETIGVAMLMGGGPAMVYGCEALAALEQFEDKQPK
jgi:AhpD family alkylhydroperoxidase